GGGRRDPAGGSRHTSRCEIGRARWQELPRMTAAATGGGLQLLFLDGPGSAPRAPVDVRLSACQTGGDSLVLVWVLGGVAPVVGCLVFAHDASLTGDGPICAGKCGCG